MSLDQPNKLFVSCEATLGKISALPGNEVAHPYLPSNEVTHPYLPGNEVTHPYLRSLLCF